MKYKTLHLNIQDKIATVILNRPKVRNAMNSIMMQEITDVFRELDKNPQVHIIVLSGNGQSFCAGADLHYIKNSGLMNRDENVNEGKKLET